jgi:hypothetical protein
MHRLRWIIGSPIQFVTIKQGEESRQKYKKFDHFAFCESVNIGYHFFGYVSNDE